VNKIWKATILPWAAKRSGSPEPKGPSPLSGLYSQVPILDLVQQAEEMAGLGFWRYDLEGAEVFWSPGVFQIYDLQPTESVTIENALCFYPPNHRSIMEAALDKASIDGTAWDLETDLISARGKKKRVRSIGRAEMAGGRITALVGVFQDVTLRHEADRKLREAAMTDDLTSLPNRRHMHQFFMDLHLEKAPLHQLHYALAMIDLDHFKLINDRYGHMVGDQVLKAVALRFQAHWLSNSFAARMGGDEFVLFIRDAHLLDDLQIASERLLTGLTQPVELPGCTVDVSATLGIAYVKHETLSLSHLLSAADTILYVAKKQQRGSAVIARGADVFLEDAATCEAIERGADMAKSG